MPLAKIHILEGQYDEERLRNLSAAVQDALIGVLKIPPDDFFQLIHVLPRNHFLHTPSFLGMRYSDDFIVLEIAFISGRPKETRLALLKELNAGIVAGTGISGYNGDGKRATHAELSFPTGVAPLRRGAFLIADSGNNRIRKVSGKGIIKTLAGTGVAGYNGDHREARTAELNYPARVVPTAHGGFLFTDFTNNRVRAVTPKGIIKTVAGDGMAGSGGDGGPAKDAQVYGPSTAVPTPGGAILISEFGGLSAGTNASRIRKVSPRGIIHTVAGIGTDAT